MNRNVLSLFGGIALLVVLSFPCRSFAGGASLTIVGSSTGFPFAAAVAERLSHTSSLRPSFIEATGSGGGAKLFCSGIGYETPDIVMMSRPIAGSERALCKRNGVHELVELKFGYDGIVLAHSRKGPRFSLTLRDLYLALAEHVPVPGKKEMMAANCYLNWQQIDPLLPDLPIQLYGPPPTSGTRDDFLRLLVRKGAESVPFFSETKMHSREFEELTNSLRMDGAYINVGEDDNLTVRLLEHNPFALGIFGYSFFEQNQEVLQAVRLDGQLPDAATIQDGSYPGSRPLYLYVKKRHVGYVPGIRRYLKEFTSERAWGPEGYLTRKGLIPLLPEERLQYAETARLLTVMEDKGVRNISGGGE